ncbi:MAG: nitronate monooxygenase family protein [Holophaga sp.]|nr:nitronate monooxygenase family protein [Holophaga sp.]
MTGSSVPWPTGPQAPVFFQGWHPFATDQLAAGFAGAGGAGVIRVKAFPDMEALSRRLAEVCHSGKGHVGLDLRGVLGEFSAKLDNAAHNLATFLIHESDLLPERLESLRAWGLPRLVVVKDGFDAAEAQKDGASALMVAEGEGLADRLMRMLKASSLPCFAPVAGNPAEGHDLLARGATGLQLRSPSLLRAGAAEFLSGFRKRLADAMGAPAFENLVEKPAPSLPTLKIRNLEVPYPIIQGGMGIGISWDRLAGSAARSGCFGIVSAIGTGYRFPGLAKTRDGRPDKPENLESTEALQRILKEALRIADGHGAVGVNVMCAINDYERVVRESVEGGARMIISGAGLPLALPGYVGDQDVALVPIVSSARALKLICKTWDHKYHRRPDAVVLEGPESGGHQGFSLEQCTDPSFALDALLPSVVAERDQWGDFPVIAAGGVWDRADIDRLMAGGAGGVQMGTRFIGTFECDAHTNFKGVILQSKRSTIKLHGSPVGMPARGVMTALHRRIVEGTAPGIRCISNCVSHCEHGKGAFKAGYCIADSLGDSQSGDLHNGLFFTGSNGWKLDDLIPVRDLVGEITEDYGLDRLATFPAKVGN